MPQYNRAELGRMATESGFVRDTFEKVLRLKEILRFMNEDEFLRLRNTSKKEFMRIFSMLFLRLLQCL